MPEDTNPPEPPCVCTHRVDQHWFRGDGTIEKCSACGCKKYRPSEKKPNAT